MSGPPQSPQQHGTTVLTNHVSSCLLLNFSYFKKFNHLSSFSQTYPLMVTNALMSVLSKIIRLPSAVSMIRHMTTAPLPFTWNYYLMQSPLNVQLILKAVYQGQLFSDKCTSHHPNHGNASFIKHHVDLLSNTITFHIN